MQTSLFSNVTAVGKQFMVEKIVWKAEFYFGVFFLSKQSSGQRQMTFLYDLLYMYPSCSIK